MVSMMLEPVRFEISSETAGLPEMRARLLGLLQTPASQLVRLLGTPATQLAQVLKAHQDKQGEATA